MTRVLVWDLVVRVFHWVLASTVFAALAIALSVDDERPGFTLHMVLGLFACVLVLLRIVWGVVGTRHARFSSFAFGPGAVLRYLRATLTRDPSAKHVGHNPGSSWAIFAVLLLVLGLGATGLLMSRGSHAAEEIHEVLAYSLLGVVAAHLLGVAWHLLGLRENLTLSMLDGRKPGTPDQAIPSARPAAAAVFVALSAGWAALLLSGYDAAARQVSLPVLGAITLGEGRGADPQEAKSRRGHRDREGHEEHEDHD